MLRDEFLPDLTGLNARRRTSHIKRGRSKTYGGNMKAISSLAVLLGLLSSLAPTSWAQAPSAVGRWQVEFTFTSETSPHRLKFDADEVGKGTYLLLDRRSNLLEPAQPTKAEWAQTVDNKIRLSGEIEFPIGNVGRDAGTLVFNGSFETADLISGDVTFVNEARGAGATRTGTFKAVRVTENTPPRVELLSPTSGKLKRGREVDVTWLATSSNGIAFQQVFLSLDDGETFSPISVVMDDHTSELAWIVPQDLPTTKKARLKVVVLSGIGVTAEDSSDGRLKVR
jgi:hypothetical protein